MVVDKMDTAQRGVEFLKKHNIGSTTFVALDKVKISFDKKCSLTTDSLHPEMYLL